MPVVVKMPKWGLTMTAGTVTDWLLQEGAEVTEGEPLFTVETEKAVNDVEAPAAGVLVKIIAPQGDEVPVSGPVAVIAVAGETVSDDDIAAVIAAGSPKTQPGAGATSGTTGRTVRAASRDDAGRINASPAARRRAQELGVDLATVQASGPDGRITSTDVEQAAAAASLDPAPREEPLLLSDGRSLSALFAGGGDGIPLVFLHGLGGSQSTWQVVLGDLVDRHRTISIDLPGHGASDKREDADYSVQGLVQTVSEAITGLVLDRPILIGHSLGGALALQIASTAPGSVRGVVAINSAGLGTEIGHELVELMSGDPGEETARGLLRLFYEDQKLVVDRGVQEMAAAQQQDGAWRAQQAVTVASFKDGTQSAQIRVDLSQVQVPVALIWGAEDRVIPMTHALDALESLPDASLSVIPGVGHVPQVEAAGRTAALIGRFARSLES